jgi:hypothetical protein
MIAAVPAAEPSGQPAAERVLGYIGSLPTETPAERSERHKRVAERRKGTPIIVHRGANWLAPENTLEAYAMAMDYGADGCEIDPRMTSDSVICLLHDDTLDRMTTGSGKVKGLLYFEVLQHPFRKVFGTANRRTRIPTFISFLALARQRAMLIHFDVKEAKIEDDIIRILDKADMWDHVVEVNGNAPELRFHPRVKLIPYKSGSEVVRDPKHVDAKRIAEFIAGGDGLIFCDGPRIAAKALGRKEYDPVPLPAGLRAWWTAQGVAADPAPAGQTK